MNGYEAREKCFVVTQGWKESPTQDHYNQWVSRHGRSTVPIYTWAGAINRWLYVVKQSGTYPCIYNGRDDVFYTEEYLTEFGEHIK
jgi:hypothetical protein